MTIDATKVVQTTETVEGGEVVVRRARDPFNPAAGSVEVSRKPVPVLDDPIEARLAALEAKVVESDALKAILVDKGVIAEADVAVAVEEVAVKR